MRSIAICWFETGSVDSYIADLIMWSSSIGLLRSSNSKTDTFPVRMGWEESFRKFQPGSRGGPAGGKLFTDVERDLNFCGGVKPVDDLPGPRPLPTLWARERT
jgi:hypothetical protein